MSNRLTQSDKADRPLWNTLAFLWLAAVTAGLAFGPIPPSAPVIPEEAHILYQHLPSPVWVPRLQALALVAMFLLSGGLVRALVPPKASGGTRMLASVLGAAVPALLLQPRLVDALGPQPLYPAWTLVLMGTLLLFTTRDGLPPPLLGLTGLFLGLALSLDAATLPALVPAAVWILAAPLLSRKTGGIALLHCAAGLTVGLAPVFLGLAPFAPGLQFGGGFPGLGELPRILLDALTWWSAPFVLLALLAAGLQLQGVVLGWIVPVGLLQLLLAATRSDLLDETRFFIVLPATWLVAYGAFRFCKGIEQGVRNLNAKKANRLPLVMTVLALAAYTARYLILFL